MKKSERIQRLRENRYLDPHEADHLDEVFAARILALLNRTDIDKHCMVDAYYYDFSVIPHGVQGSLNLWKDCYLIFGITYEGEMVSKLVDRRDLDSKDPIVDGNVIHSEKPANGSAVVVPEIKQCFDPKLLSTPAPEFLKIFNCERASPPINNEVDVSKMELCEDCENKVVTAFMKACRECHEGRNWREILE